MDYWGMISRSSMDYWSMIYWCSMINWGCMVLRSSVGSYKQGRNSNEDLNKY